MLQVVLFFTKHCIYAYNLQFNDNGINNHNYHLLNKKPFLQGAHFSLPVGHRYHHRQYHSPHKQKMTGVTPNFARMGCTVWSLNIST